MSGRAGVHRLRLALERAADHPAAPALLALLAALEATLFPAPTEALLIALVLRRPGRAARLAAVAVGGSLAGALVGYGAGQAWLAAYAEGGQLARLAALYRENALLALATSGYTPIPFLLYPAAAGALGVPLPLFALGTLLGRGLKYGVLAALTRALGPAVRSALRRQKALGTALVLALLAVLAWLAGR